MANKNFTDFTLKTPASGDFLVGYSANGSAEYKTTVNALISSYATTTSLNAASSVLLPTSVFRTASATFATNTALNAASSVLLRTSVYQNASAAFASNTALNAASSVLLPTSVYKATSGVYTTVQSNSASWNYQGTDLKQLSGNWQSTTDYVNENYENWDNTYTTVQSNSANWEPKSSIFYTNLTATNAFISNLTATNLTSVQTVNVSVTSLSANVSNFLVFQTSSLSATTPRTLAERFGEVYNVKDYGAKGDGIADDAPAIRKAIRAAEYSPLSSATVYFPTGTYNLTSIDLETAGDWAGIRMTSLPSQYISLSGLQLKTYKSQTQRIFTIGAYYYNGVHRTTRPNNWTMPFDLRFIGNDAVIKSGLWMGGDSGNWQAGSSGTGGAVRGLRLKFKFEGGGGSGAEGYAKVSQVWNGQIGQTFVTNGGTNYTSPPTVTLDVEGSWDPVLNESQVQGVGATFQAGINTSTGSVTGVTVVNAGSAYNVGAPRLVWFAIHGLTDATFEGLKFLSTFGGPGGERPIRYDVNPLNPSVTALRFQDSGQTGKPGEIGWGDVYASMGATWAITYWGGSPPGNSSGSNNRKLPQRSIKINNCEFRDFIMCADIATCDSAIITNNKMYWTYGVGSAGGRLDWYAGVGGPRYACKSLVFENNIIDGSLEMDHTQVWNAVQNEYFNQVITPDNGIIVAGGESAKINNNIIKHMGVEFIGPITNLGQDIYAFDTQEPVGPVSICNNVLVGGFPKGYNCLPTFGGNYGIRQADRSNLLIDGNHIQNISAPILIANYKVPGTATTGYHPVTSVEVPRGCFVTNNVITQDYRPLIGTEYVPASADWRGAISIGTTEDTVIANNYVRYNTYRYLGDNWDGRSATWGSVTNRRFPHPLVIGASNYSKVLVENNTFITGPKENPNGKSIAVETDANVIFKNNTFKGFDILLSRSGGGGGPVYFENTTFDGERYLADSYNDVSFDRQIFSFYPQTTGWHLVNAGGRRVGSVSVHIQTDGEAFYGNTFNQEMPNWKNQDTKLQLAWTGFFFNPTNNFTIDQTYHVATSAFPITKTAFNLSYAPYFYLYVDKLTEILALNITGSNGAKALGYVNVDKGKLTTVVVTSGGNGLFNSLTNPPQISIKTGSDGGQELVNRWKIKGSGAMFSSTVDVNGLVTGIAATNSGSGYQQPIYISFEDQSYSYGGGKGLNGTYTVVDILSSTPINQSDLNTVVINLQPGSKSITQLGYNGANTVQRFGTSTPTISSSNGAPNTKPEFIGQEFLDTANNKWYKAKGIFSSADWLLLN